MRLRVKTAVALFTVLALCFCIPVSVSAESDLTLIVSAPASLPAVGETFNVDVSIANNPGVASIQLTLAFDHSVVECTAADEGEAISTMMSAINPKAEDGAIVAAASAEEMTADGVLMTCTFKVLGTGSPQFAVTDSFFTDASAKKLNYSVTGAKKKDSVPETSRDPGNSGGSVPSTTPTDPGSTPGTQVIEPDPQAGVDTEQSAFTDTVGHWAAGYIDKAVELGLFKGYPDGTFGPDKNVSRGEFVTVLHRIAGTPAPTQTASFEDTKGIWCESAISWAFEKGYVNGRSESQFAPDEPVTRQEAMKILFLYSGATSGMEALENGMYDKMFKDSGDMASWAKDSVYWAVFNGLISGTSADTLNPVGKATRGQLAKILVNYTEKITKW